jgi:hypothetical protein
MIETDDGIEQEHKTLADITRKLGVINLRVSKKRPATHVRGGHRCLVLDENVSNMDRLAAFAKTMFHRFTYSLKNIAKDNTSSHDCYSTNAFLK